MNVTAGLHAGTLSVTANNSCQPSPARTLALTINPGCRTAAPEEEPLAETAPGESLMAKIYPNPFTEQFTIEFTTGNSKEQVAIRLFDMTSRLVKEEFIEAEGGINRVEVKMDEEDGVC